MDPFFRKLYGKKFPHVYGKYFHNGYGNNFRNVYGKYFQNGYGNTLHKIHDNAELLDLIHYFQQPYPARENSTLPLEKWILDPSFNPRA